jgi:ribonuclease P protein component
VGERFSFPKTARVRRRREFLTLQRNGRRRHTEHFVVIRCPTDAPDSRIGITVSSRVGNAVIRNRVKRFVRELFRVHRRSFVPAQDLVVIAKPGADALSYAQAATELSRALEIHGRR